jgi:hypothetical protein
LSGSYGISITGSAASFTGNLSGDVTGTQTTTKVVALQNNAVASTTPTAGQVLEFVAGSWTPTTIATGVVPIIIGGNSGGKINSASNFIGLFSGNATNTETDLELPVPRGGTINNFYITQQGGSTGVVYTLRTGNQGGTMTNSTLTCTGAVVSGVTTCKDLTHSVIVGAGQTVTITNSANPNAAVAWSAQLQ